MYATSPFARPSFFPFPFLLCIRVRAKKGIWNHQVSQLVGFFDKIKNFSEIEIWLSMGTSLKKEKVAIIESYVFILGWQIHHSLFRDKEMTTNLPRKNITKPRWRPSFFLSPDSPSCVR